MIVIIITWVYNNVSSKIILYVFYVIIIHWPLSTMCSEELEGYVRVLSRPYRKHTHRVCFNDWKKNTTLKVVSGLIVKNVHYLQPTLFAGPVRAACGVHVINMHCRKYLYIIQVHIWITYIVNSCCAKIEIILFLFGFPPYSFGKRFNTPCLLFLILSGSMNVYYWFHNDVCF